MRFAIATVSLALFSQPSFGEDLSARMAASKAETAAFNRCPTALADVNAAQQLAADAARQVDGLNARPDRLAVLCQAALNLDENGRKTVIDLKACQDRGLINAPDVIRRIEERYAKPTLSLSLTRKICPHQP